MAATSQRLLLQMLTLLAAACASRTVPANDDVKNIAWTTGDYRFELHDAGGECVLRNAVSGAEPTGIATGIPWPCNFYADEGGDIVTLQASDGQIALIESSVRIGNSGDCDTRVRAVRLDDTSVALSEYTDRVAACTPFRWDQKMFVGLFEN